MGHTDLSTAAGRARAKKEFDEVKRTRKETKQTESEATIKKRIDKKSVERNKRINKKRKSDIKSGKVKDRGEIGEPIEPQEIGEPIEPQEKKEGLQAPNEEGVIDLTQQGQREDEEFTTGDKLKALGTGAVIGAGLGFGAVAIGAGGIGAAASLLFGRTTQAAATKLLTHTPTPGATITVNGVKSSISNIANTAVRNGRWSSVANNAKNFLLKKTYLQKLAATTKDPRLHLAILGSVLYTSLFWGQNEKGDALTTLGINQNTALKNGDWESVEEIDAMIQETLNITAGKPIIGFLESEWAKFEAAAKTSEVNMKEAQKIKEEQLRIEEQGESDFAKERRESDEAAIERKKEEENRQDERWEEKQDEQDKRDEEDRDAETARYEKIKADNDAEKLADVEIMQEVWRLRGLGGEDNKAKANELEKTAYTN